MFIKPFSHVQGKFQIERTLKDGQRECKEEQKLSKFKESKAINESEC